MNVKIQETGKIETLGIIDPNSGVDWINDLIGNANALNDGQFVWSDEDDAYIANQDTYDWWAQYIDDTNATLEDVETLAEKLDIDAGIIWDRIDHYTDGDYGSHRNRSIQAMRDIEEECANAQ